MLGVTNWVKITANQAFVRGEKLYETDDNLLTLIYRNEVKDYPKFFKMDTLCRLGFIGSELLLKGLEPLEDTAIVLFNRSGSFVSDSHYQKTISCPEDFFPSPSIFVYTLSNIVTGEIAIRNKFYGETSFYLTKGINPQQISETAKEVFSFDKEVKRLVTGYVECSDTSDIYACLFLIEKVESAEEILETIIKNI